MRKYTYKNIKTGKKIFSDIPLKEKDLILVAVIKDVRMKSNEVKQK